MRAKEALSLFRRKSSFASRRARLADSRGTRTKGTPFSSRRRPRNGAGRWTPRAFGPRSPTRASRWWSRASTSPRSRSRRRIPTETRERRETISKPFASRFRSRRATRSRTSSSRAGPRLTRICRAAGRSRRARCTARKWAPRGTPWRSRGSPPRWARTRRRARRSENGSRSSRFRKSLARRRRRASPSRASFRGTRARTCSCDSCRISRPARSGTRPGPS